MPQFENVVKRVHYANWWGFIKQVEAKPNSLFRGQANFLLDAKGEERVGEWSIKSLFNRTFPNSYFGLEEYNFKQWLANIDLYRKQNLLLKKFKGRGFLDVLQFFQHYGVPTPLIDFTRDPDIALYFAITGIHHHGLKRCSSELNNRYITVVEIDTRVLSEDFGIRVADDSHMSFELLDEYGIEYSNGNWFMVTEPIVHRNENLTKQKGAFFYLDSWYSLEEELKHHLIRSGRDEKRIPITYHNIPYQSVLETNGTDPNIYCYLMLKEKLGFNLFNDLQGVKYDYNVSGILSSLNCRKKQECNCSLILREHGLVA